MLSFSYRSAYERTPIKNYFIRRFFRIAPLYYLAIVYYLWQDGFGPRHWLGDAKFISAANIVSNFSFLHGFNPYWITSIVPGGWSIAVEVMFYFLLPFLFAKIKSIGDAFTFTIITLVFKAALLYVLQSHSLISAGDLWQEYLFLYFPNQLPVFALGILLYFIIRDKDRLTLSPKHLFFGFVIAVFSFCIQQNLIFSQIFYFGLAFLLLVLAFEKYHPKLFFNRAIYYIGKISYTIYLTHAAAIYILHKLSAFNLISGTREPLVIANYLLNYLMVLGISVILSSVLYYTIEWPMQQLGRKLIKAN